MNKFENIYTLKDFIKLGKDIKLNPDDDFVNFKYRDIAKDLLKSEHKNYLFSIFDLVKFGKPEPKEHSYYPLHPDQDVVWYNDILYENEKYPKRKDIVFYSEKYYEGFKINRRTSSYIKKYFKTVRFYIIFKSDAFKPCKSEISGDYILIENFKFFKKYAFEFQKDAWELIKSKYQNFDTFQVPKEYKIGMKL